MANKHEKMPNIISHQENTRYIHVLKKAQRPERLKRKQHSIPSVGEDLDYSELLHAVIIQW